MADEQLGKLNKEQLTDLRAELTLFQDGVKDLSTSIAALSGAGALEGLSQNFNISRNAIQNIAKLSAETLATTKGQKELEREIGKIKKDITQSDTNQAILKERIKNATGQEKQDLTKVLNLETARGVQLKEAAASAKVLADETKKVVDIGKGLESIGKALGQIPILGGALSSIFTNAAASARKFGADGVNPMLARIMGAGQALQKLFLAGIGPAIINAGEQVGNVNKQLGLGLESSRKVADNFRQISEQSESTRINTTALVAANGELAKSLGATVQYSEQQLKTFIQNTEYLGASAESAAKIEKLSISTNVSSEKYSERLASAANSAGRNLGIHMPLAKVMEKIQNLSSTTLLNFRRSPEELTKAVMQVEKLGLSFEQLKSTTSALLDFESSIQNELEAELLVGKELNLERARAAALMGKEEDLAKEIAKQVGTIAEFEQMNVIQRESLAKALGMSADQMGDMLLKQDMMNKLGDKAKDASLEQLKAARDLAKEKGISEGAALLEIQRQETVGKQFQQTILKLKEVFVDIVSKVEPIVKQLADLIARAASSPLTKLAIGSAVGLSAAISLAKTVMSTIRGTDLMPMVVRMSGAGAGGMLTGGGRLGGGLYNQSGYYKDGQLQNVQGKIPAGSKFMQGGLTTMGKVGGVAAIGGLAGAAMMQSENEGVQAVGSALTGASTGAMVGMVAGPVGMAVGAAVGGGISLLMNYMSKKDEDKKKEEQRKAEEASRQLSQYDLMEQHLRKMAEQETKIYMDANEVGIAQRVGNYSVGN